MRIRLLHCGDIHLDAPFTSLSDAEGRPEQRRQELKQVISRIVELAAEEQVDLLLVCGDLYEHGYVRKSTIQFVSDQFERIQKIPVLIIPGNHDPATADSFYYHFRWPSNVCILREEKGFYEHAGSGARVYTRLPLSDKLDRSRINILMCHGTLDMPFSTDAYQPLSSKDIEDCGFDYCALGHFHTRMFGAGIQKRIFNAGSPEPLGFDEEGNHGVYLSMIEKVPGEESRIEAEFKVLNLRHFLNLSVQAGGCLSDEQVAIRAKLVLRDAGSSEDLYRIFLQGYITQGFKIDPLRVADLLETEAFFIRVVDQTTPEYDLALISDEPGLRGLFARKMLNRAAAAGEEEKQLIMQALYYGLEAIDEGRVCI